LELTFFESSLQDKNKRDAIICLAEEVITDLEEQLGGFKTGVSCEKLCLGKIELDKVGCTVDYPCH